MYFKLVVVIAAIYLLFSLSFVRVLGQDKKEATINKLQAETSNGLVIKVWTDRAHVRLNEDLTVRISITNTEKKPVYIVKKDKAEIAYDRGDVLIQAPLPFPEELAEYDYSFYKLRPGRSYQGQFIISRSLLQEDYDLNIRVGVGVVDEITGLDRELKPTDDPVSLRGPLRRRMQVFVLGDLRVIVTR